ncbi:conserved hypothetical protein [Paecilomyces variotii No. 5]|uniref:WD repeat protein n=1 Tax=Byssochlamys spectabilis (strain No. 5 / NBRC 109023) TaxID=1356009 RepID=V5G4T9_BYSSN|nr:conserved hypothetical protein [Paecilomyces variotii No. 5]
MLSFDTSRYMLGPSSDASESPSVEKEAQTLLSQFLSAPRRTSSSPRPGSEGRGSHGHPQETANGCLEAVRKREAEYTRAMKGSSRVLPQRSSTRPSTAWQQHHNTATASTNRGPVSGITSTIPLQSKKKTRVNQISMNRHDESDNYSLTDSSHCSISDTDKPTPRKRGRPSLRGARGSSSLLREDRPEAAAPNQSRGIASRRPRRSVAVPANYFGKYPGFALENGIIENEPQRRSPQGPVSSSSESSRSTVQQHQIRSARPDVRRTFASEAASSVSDKMSMLLHGREIGNRLNHRIRSQTSLDRLRHVKSWKGASNDVIVLAWSEDSTRFAVGAAAQCDEHNMQYNRGNNLILGDLVSNSLKALPDHRIPRPRPAGAASQQAYNTVDPHLYMSVTAMQWYGDTLFTASYDNTVKLWDVSSHAAARCSQTLYHSSKVQVMARSNFSPNLLATGAQAFGLWNLDSRTYMPLEIVRRNPTKNLELIPSSLAWGTSQASKNVLVGGMSGRDIESEDVSREGHMAVWRVNEASISCDQLMPNAQNVFDITWHPTLPLFATGSAAPSLRSGTTARDTRSVVRTYDALKGKRCVVELDCPALDINDVKFCPTNSNYISASCTDGVTYVWDMRYPSDILHKLQHGEPLNQLDENLTREQADVGVRVALWGDTTQRFYTGGSDGCLKTWDILQSPENAHVQDVVSLEEEIMCASFSEDKTNMLIGDAAGGVHVLSSAPFEHSGSMKFEHAGESLEQIKEEEESAAEMANKLLDPRQLVRHPVYGVGQGPLYNGPYAAWARPACTPSDLLSITPLIEDIQALQLDGPPVDKRPQLDVQSQRYVAAQIRLARIRNERRSAQKRKRDASRSGKVAMTPKNVIDLCSEDEETVVYRPRRRKTKKREMAPIITQVGGVIDLTGDTDSEDTTTESQRLLDMKKVNKEDDERLLEALEEDYWWPDSGIVDANIQDLDD